MSRLDTSSLMPLDLVRLTALMQRTSGRPEIRVALLDGPVAEPHPDLAQASSHLIAGPWGERSPGKAGAATAHGTFVAGILAARRSSAAPAICPGCTLLVCPIFADDASDGTDLPSTTPAVLAAAIMACVKAGAHVVNLSAALVQPTSRAELELEQALDYAAARGVLIVAAAGNQAMIGSAGITRHPWVIPVVGYDRFGRPMEQSNLGASIARRGLGAPGDGITSLGLDGQPLTLGGTSVAAPFVTGALALLWSESLGATGGAIKRWVLLSGRGPRKTIVPPLLDAWGAYQLMRT